jgi:predicted CXXCH cytochrome family protein
MAALFAPWTNTAYRIVLVALVVVVAGVLVGLMIYVRTPYNTRQYLAIDQPVEFDHRHHVRDDGIDCLYCHSAAETSPSAGIPSTDLCMGCHNQIWNDSPLLEPVRRSYFSGQPIPWNRVHDLGDFAYFNHAVHVQRGIGCVNCHGRVDLMPRVYRVAPLHMGWCLDCHRNPREHLVRPPEVAEHSSMWGATVEAMELDVPATRQITRLTTCTACHR